MDTIDIVQMAKDVITSELKYDAEVGRILATYLYATKNEEASFKPHRMIVNTLLQKYVESMFEDPSILGICAKACPEAAIRPICKIIKHHSAELLAQSSIKSPNHLHVFQLLYQINDFLMFNTNSKHKTISRKIVSRPYMIEFLKSCQSLPNELEVKNASSILQILEGKEPSTASL